MGILDYLALAAVFIGLLSIGRWSSKKTRRADDFLLAGRSLNKLQAGFSLAASDLGGSGLLGTCALCYTAGLSGAWWCWSAAPAFFLLGCCLVGRLRPLAVSTIPEFLELRYDKKNRILACFLQTCALVASLSAQFFVGAVALEALFGVPQVYGLIISVLLVLSYTATGGLNAVVHTDIFNFCILVGSLLISIPAVLYRTGGLSYIAANVSERFFHIGELGVMEPFSWVLMCIFMYGTQQVFLQRVFAAKDNSVARFAYCFTGGMYIMYGLGVGLIGIAMSVLVPGLADSNSVYSVMIRTVLPTGLAGLALGGIFAASLSTADSTILAGSTLFVNDIYKVFINKEASEQRVLWVSRITTGIICVGGVIVANLMQNLIDIVYLAGLFYSAAVFFPVVFGVYWKRGNAEGCFAAILTSVAVGFFVEYGCGGAWLGLPSNAIAALAGILVLVVVSLCTPPPSEEQLKGFESV